MNDQRDETTLTVERPRMTTAEHMREWIRSQAAAPDAMVPMFDAALAEAARPTKELLEELLLMTRADDDSAPLADELPVEWTDRAFAVLGLTSATLTENEAPS